MIGAEAGFGGLGFEFAVTAILLANAWRRVIGEE
jgi:hypothetical protein